MIFAFLSEGVKEELCGEVREEGVGLYILIVQWVGRSLGLLLI